MSTVDVSFEVRCECLPRDYGYALFRALAEERMRGINEAYTRLKECGRVE